jgi:hypothetical protein
VSGATVTIGGVAATSVVVVNGTTITAVTGPHAPGAVDITVTNPGPSGGTKTGAYYYVPYYVPPPGDFDGDGKSDLVWRNMTTGQNAVWYMNGSSLVSSNMMPPVTDQAWHIVGIGDFDGDGKPDLVWRNTTTGQNAVWYMNGSGTSLVSSNMMPPMTDQAWQIVGIGDFNGDGKPDLVWRNTTTGQNAVWYMNGSGTSLVSSNMMPPVTDQAWQIVGR